MKIWGAGKGGRGSPPLCRQTARRMNLMVRLRECRRTAPEWRCIDKHASVKSHFQARQMRIDRQAPLFDVAAGKTFIERGKVLIAHANLSARGHSQNKRIFRMSDDTGPGPASASPYVTANPRTNPTPGAPKLADLGNMRLLDALVKAGTRRYYKKCLPMVANTSHDAKKDFPRLNGRSPAFTARSG